MGRRIKPSRLKAGQIIGYVNRTGNKASAPTAAQIDTAPAVYMARKGADQARRRAQHGGLARAIGATKGPIARRPAKSVSAPPRSPRVNTPANFIPALPPKPS